MLKDCQFCINTISVISFSTKKSMDNKSQANYVNVIDLIFQLFTKTTTNETMGTVMFSHLRDIQTLSWSGYRNTIFVKLYHFNNGRRINNGNWTEWSAIWAQIICMISKLNERAARVRFEITSMISDQNCTTRGSITTLLHPFWNCPNTGLGQFKYFIDTVLSWFEIKFIHFLGGKKKKSLETIDLPHDTLCFSFSCNFIGYFKQALKSDWLFCF